MTRVAPSAASSVKPVCQSLTMRLKPVESSSIALPALGAHRRRAGAGVQYFTLPKSIVRWMGDYAVLDPRPDGEFTLDINGVPVRGRYLELDPPRRLVISSGHAGSDTPGQVSFAPRRCLIGWKAKATGLEDRR